MNDLLKPITTNGKTIILAYDQGFEHGPRDFNMQNIDPSYVMDIAKKEDLDGFACQIGVARHYYTKKYRDIPLIVKVNGKTRFENDNPVSLQHTSVEHAANIGAKAVGYTIYLGSEYEQDMLREFGRICEEAHNKGLASICWMYPRGPNIDDETSTENLAYGSRIAMELGADMVKTKSNGDVGGMSWIVASAAKASVVFAGGSKQDDLDFLKKTKKGLDAGADGLAVGRNIWQSEHPYLITDALKQVVYDGEDPSKAIKSVNLD